jgi:hypothetical protein
MDWESPLPDGADALINTLTDIESMPDFDFPAMRKVKGEDKKIFHDRSNR